MSEMVKYWDRGVRNVPDMTGARLVLDARDLRALAVEFGIELPLRNVLDVGCGTGRLAQVCADGYLGVDIAPSAVEYCVKRELPALLIEGPDDLPDHAFGWITCISVFTHISRASRRQYLGAFRARSADVIVDIIPGDGSGDVALWTADPDEFEADLRELGWRARGRVDQCWDAGQVRTTHRYYRLEADR